MAFLAYRFIPAAALVALVFRRALRRLPRAGWRAGLVMGVFLTAGYVFQTLGLEHTTRVQRRLHHRPVRGADAAVRARCLRRRASARPPGARRACRRSGCCCCPVRGGDCILKGDGARVRCARARSRPTSS